MSPTKFNTIPCHLRVSFLIVNSIPFSNLASSSKIGRKNVSTPQRFTKSVFTIPSNWIKRKDERNCGGRFNKTHRLRAYPFCSLRDWRFQLHPCTTENKEFCCTWIQTNDYIWCSSHSTRPNKRCLLPDVCLSESYQWRPHKRLLRRETERGTG